MMQRIAAVGVKQIGLSIIVVREIRFGVMKSGSQRLARRVKLVLDRIATFPMESPVEEHYTEIRDTLELAGTPIDPNDLLIATHARALG